ncbi:MAG: PspC domain-containing protein [Acidimicrobiales bacterium]
MPPAGAWREPHHRHRWWYRPRDRGPLRRSRDSRIAGGVAGGLSARLGVDANIIRILFVVVSVGGGAGFALYVAAWLLIPRQGSDESNGRRALADRRSVALAIATGTVLVAVLLVLAGLGFGFLAGLAWLSAIGVAGLVLVWRGADDDERAFLRELVEQAPLLGPAEHRSRRAMVARIAAGGLLVLAGLGGLAGSRHLDAHTAGSFVAVNVVILGFLIVFGPWWLRLARELAVERRERVRTEERANVAAAVHDSVLQTLALIQRAAGDQREVTRLARAQERELRSWLFEGRPPGSFDEANVSSVADAVAVIERDVEAAHRVPVETVLVGDCPLTDDLRALLAAGREAVVNAAKWSEAPFVSLFVEVEAGRVSVFVRDRGAGFDPGAVGADRRGIAESIRARTLRHGGTATIRSTPGQGTEVELVMPRKDG